jgi:hypothetical protein
MFLGLADEVIEDIEQGYFLADRPRPSPLCLLTRVI